MDAWGPGPFDNDAAADWVGDLGERGLAAVVRAFDDVEAVGDGYLDARAGAAAVAAAETVARLASRSDDRAFVGGHLARAA